MAAQGATDPVGAKQNPPVIRAPNGVLKEIAEHWGVGKATYDPEKIRVPTLLILAEWDQDTPLYMAQEVFSKLVNTPYKRHGRFLYARSQRRQGNLSGYGDRFG